jgi:hypothetical protein
VGCLAWLLLGLDVHQLAAHAVITDEAAVLPLAVHDIGVCGVDRGLIAIATDSDVPVFVRDPG